MKKAIRAQGLSKNFKSYQKEAGFLGSLKSLYQRHYQIKNAVEDFNLEINKGEIIGLLGPNGAGKTTLMKMFTGIIIPSRGHLEVVGHNPSSREKAFRKKIALVMGQKSQLWWDIPAMDSLLLLQKYYELPKAQFEERIEQMSTLLRVKDLLHIHVRKLSLGERMKLELMASLIHSPEIIFLDEPTIGLDLVAQDNIRQFILDYHRKNQTTIILTSHYMADVQALCSRLVLISGGMKKFDGDLSTFERLLGSEKTLTFNFTDAPKKRDLEIFTKHKALWSEDGRSVELRVEQEDISEVSRHILKHYDVNDFGTEKLPIEKVMKELMLRDELK